MLSWQRAHWVASWWRAFKNAYWPQVSGSIVLASVLVLSIVSGFFVAPSLPGGPGEATVGAQMYADLIFNCRNGVGLATALGAILTLIL